MQCAVTERTDDENRIKATGLRVSESVKVHIVFNSGVIFILQSALF